MKRPSEFPHVLRLTQAERRRHDRVSGIGQPTPTFQVRLWCNGCQAVIGHVPDVITDLTSITLAMQQHRQEKHS